jgi:hypothetical protein
VASLPPKKQDEYLWSAEKEKLTVAQLREILSPSKESKPFQISKWFGSAFDKIKSLAAIPERRKELKDALRPLVELYETL